MNTPPLSAAARGQNGGTVVGLMVGLVIGVLIAFGVVWYLNKTPLPFMDKGVSLKKPEPEKPGPAPGQPKTPEALPGKPGDKVGEKPRFEFYKILPGGQEATPGPAPAAAAPAPAEAPAGETLFLQAGAFQKAGDADNLKAKLALLGVEAGVQEVAIPDKGTMHRVRVGPFAKADEMNRVRNQLSQNGIQATVVKIKDAAKN